MKRWMMRAAMTMLLVGLTAPVQGQQVTVLGSQEEILSMLGADEKLANGGALTAEEIEQLRKLAVLLRISGREEAERMSEPAEYRRVLKEALYRLDVIPAGLVLGQAAYESGYATSRFAAEGNALFGQWTYGGDGMVPDQQRKKLGGHRIASYEWPFDSVRDYFISLSSHPAYEDFRRIRADLKAAGKPLSSLRYAGGKTCGLNRIGGETT